MRLFVAEQEMVVIFVAIEQVVNEPIFADGMEPNCEQKRNTCHEDFGTVVFSRGQTDAVDETYGTGSLDIEFEDAQGGALFVSRLNNILQEYSPYVEYEIKEV